MLHRKETLCFGLVGGAGKRALVVTEKSGKKRFRGVLPGDGGVLRRLQEDGGGEKLAWEGSERVDLERPYGVYCGGEGCQRRRSICKSYH